MPLQTANNRRISISGRAEGLFMDLYLFILAPNGITQGKDVEKSSITFYLLVDRFRAMDPQKPLHLRT